MTRREFRGRMQAGELKACILPIAAIEQHLEHLEMEHDWRSVCLIANQVAQNLNPEVLVAEGIMAGISEHHMKHPGTLTLNPGTFINVVFDLVDSLARAGFTNILVLNGHGGNIDACRGIWDQLLRRVQVNVHFLPYWEVLNESDAHELLKSGRRLPQDLPGHAQEFETSMAMAAFPENVRIEALGAQSDPTPAMATAKTGHEFIHRITERVTDYLQKMIKGENTLPTPPFHP